MTGDTLRRRYHRYRRRNALVSPIPVATTTASPITASCGLSPDSSYPSVMRPNKIHPPVCSDQNKVLCETCLPDPNTSDPGFLAESSTCYRQRWGLNVRSTVAGYWRRASGGRTGLRSNFPPQFGHLPCRRSSAHSLQNVHSKEQIMASRDSAGRSRLQHSQFGFMSNIGPPTPRFWLRPSYARSRVASFLVIGRRGCRLTEGQHYRPAAHLPESGAAAHMRTPPEDGRTAPHNMSADMMQART
jgi:hypothetical protein